ncbi:DUF2523 domain-containing protein [Acinetobacter junii]|uniref:DUF2523 family protein n=1 Tax=Acinetobacter junii TaxID=40215 RepID=UPI000B3CAB4E|nr:DUF2523 family protein [Acinetobacter junii]AWA47940.1 DUF2523 domain-containing protein [Acinetobacter junii]AWA47953.1 DUF2523 domain-containing protein [Acinetobacter junii]AWA47966.1 DUF2523 domain-containing protein [Acinetobacter junii]AWA47979.1 DUF2523 domain-containing protein [Acinetobacter junii]QEE13971.1 DUF2523 domain-containing protein [Acinetobacter junii]
MWSKLADLFTSLQKGALKNILTGAGLMLTSSTLVFTAFAAAVNALRNSLSGVSADVLSLAHLTGFDVAISLVLGALVTRLTLNSTKLALKKM